MHIQSCLQDRLAFNCFFPGFGKEVPGALISPGRGRSRSPRVPSARVGGDAGTEGLEGSRAAGGDGQPGRGGGRRALPAVDCIRK